MRGKEGGWRMDGGGGGGGGETGRSGGNVFHINMRELAA